LRSSNLDLLGLTAAISIRCNELSNLHGVTIEVQHEGVPPDLPGEVSLVLFRVIEEALNNSLKHAAARHVTVSLRSGHALSDWLECGRGSARSMANARLNRGPVPERDSGHRCH
jgi:signal transduction histidine kinase